MTASNTVSQPAPTTARGAPPSRSVPMPWLKPGIFIGALAPLAAIVLRGLTGGLGANPIAEIENELGLTALIFILAATACTPARKLFEVTWPARVRRELGLFAFFYASLHLLTYALADLGLDWGAILADIVKRPFITVGFLAFVLITPLALTSTNWSVRKLGFKRWQSLHRLVYVAGVLAVIHFIWRVKIDVTQPMTYAVVLGILFSIRLAYWWQGRVAKQAAARRR